ncbi:MAG: cytochrome P450 family protein [Candidatus Promineifilaceae bacterium]
MKIKHPIRMNSAEFNQYSHEHFAWLRENKPVYQGKLTRISKTYLITRYADVNALLLDSERLVKNPNSAKTESGKSTGMWLPKAFRPLMHNMLNSDGPDHRRLRNLVHKAFTPRMIAKLRPRIEAIANELLHEATCGSPIDLIEAFALPLPITVIAEMVGIPPADRAQFRAWTERIIVNPTPLNLARATFAIRSFMRYMLALADQRRAEPQDDLLTALVQAEDEGDKLTQDELVGTIFLLLVAGHETTVNLISNGTRALLENPDQFELLKSQPDLIDSAIEEMLRYDGPLQTTEQAFAKRAFELHGVTIPQGALVMPSILSANRDEAAFAHADQFDIQRSPNKHLAFGKGLHYCLGAPLARLEAKIAFCALMQHAPNLQLAVPSAELRYKQALIIHRLEALPVVLNR